MTPLEKVSKQGVLARHFATPRKTLTEKRSQISVALLWYRECDAPKSGSDQNGRSTTILDCLTSLAQSPDPPRNVSTDR